MPSVATREHRPRGRQRPVERSRVRHARVAARVQAMRTGDFSVRLPATHRLEARSPTIQRDRRAMSACVRTRACRQFSTLFFLPARAAARVAGHADRRFLGAPAERPHRAGRQDRRHVQRDRRGQRAHGLRARACRPGGGARGQDPHAGEVRAAERFVGGDGGLGQRPGRRPAVADHRGDACHHRGGAGRSAADGAARRRWPAAAGRVPAAGDDRQHDDQAVVGVHLGSDARGARGRHRRQAGRPGAGARGDRRVEGPDRDQ